MWTEIIDKWWLITLWLDASSQRRCKNNNNNNNNADYLFTISLTLDPKIANITQHHQHSRKLPPGAIIVRQIECSSVFSELIIAPLSKARGECLNCTLTISSNHSATLCASMTMISIVIFSYMHKQLATTSLLMSSTTKI